MTLRDLSPGDHFLFNGAGYQCAGEISPNLDRYVIDPAGKLEYMSVSIGVTPAEEKVEAPIRQDAKQSSLF